MGLELGPRLALPWLVLVRSLMCAEGMAMTASGCECEDSEEVCDCEYGTCGPRRVEVGGEDLSRRGGALRWSWREGGGI